MKDFISTELLESLVRKGLCYKEIGKKVGISRDAVVYIFRKRGIKNRPSKSRPTKFKLNNGYFSEINSAKKAYILGFLYADGYNQETCGTVQLTLNDQDKYILYEIGEELFDGNISILKRTKSSHGLFLYSKELSADLKNKGCHQNKSLTLKFPTRVQVPEKYISHFIRGIFDGDGCISIHDSRPKNGLRAAVRIAGTEDIVFNISDIFNKIGIVNYFYKPKAANVQYICISSLENVRKVYDYIYDNAEIFLSRKKEKFEKFFKMKGEQNAKYL